LDNLFSNCHRSHVDAGKTSHRRLVQAGHKREGFAIASAEQLQQLFLIDVLVKTSGPGSVP
jgi:hypothetical protein